MFIIQFLGALEDNLFRNAVFVLTAFQIAASQGYSSGVIISIGAGLFIIPFFLFSATAGTLADRMEKTRLVRWLSFIDLPLMFMSGLALVTQDVTFLLFMLFLLGVQATFFGPVKYAILPQLVFGNELVSANAWVQGGTFIAILIGTIIGGALVTLPYGPALVATLMTCLAFTAWLSSFLVPRTGIGEKAHEEHARLWSDVRPLLREAMRNPPLWRAILGISWFWFVGSLFLALLPNYVKDVLDGTPAIVTFLLSLFVVGIALGAGVYNKLLRGKIEIRIVPIAMMLMASAMLFLSLHSLAPAAGRIDPSLLYFITHEKGLTISALFLFMAAAGGFYSVPLYATLQARSDPERRSRIIAANNVMNALFMVGASVFSFIMFKLGSGVATVFLAVSLLCFPAAFTFFEHILYRVFAALLRLKFRLFYRARTRGLENAETAKYRGVVYIVNHMSWLDGLVAAAFLPGNPVIACSTAMARKWYMRPYYLFSGHPPVDPADTSSLKYLVGTLKAGRPVVLFPEGRLSHTGLLMKVYETPGIIASRAKAPVLPVRIDGLQYTPFSMLRGKIRMSLFPDITITVMPPVDLRVDAGLPSRQKRLAYGNRLYDIMADMLFAACDIEQTVYRALLDAARINGHGKPILEDTDRKPLSYRRIMVISRLLGRKFAGFTLRGDKVGVLLPNGAGVVGVFFGLLAYGRVPAMLNYTSGAANLRNACIAADIDIIITSRRFVRLLKLDQAMQDLAREAQIVYLEDLRKTISIGDRLNALFESCFAGPIYRRLNVRPDEPAAVLFTSGSESAPKGVVLSHKNLIANRYQSAARIDLNASDVLFNALPVFHSFGLSVGLILPLLCGVRVFLYPSPLHYRIIPELVYATNATILISTDTFLSGYARMAHPYDFYSLRYVVAGGEKLKEETRHMWFEKFGIRILEGYGVTETAPVLSINTPMHCRNGTAGRMVPGVEYRLRKIEGIENGGSLVVRGPNVMLGYLKNERPGVLQPPPEGWYDTGDIVEIDGEGFIKIIGRARRFAKVGGEMVSLAAVEAAAQAVCPENLVAAVAAPDARKGEQIVLFTDFSGMTREKITDVIQAHRLPEIMIPRKIVILGEIPLLGTGKADYVRLNEMARREAVQSG